MAGMVVQLISRNRAWLELQEGAVQREDIQPVRK